MKSNERIDRLAAQLHEQVKKFRGTDDTPGKIQLRKRPPRKA